eukprot:GHVO01050313.1.p1 GENE.GHVO01050313.1~~GHVO01050313.1.p1  ORF type:complete len:537 (-),score=47.64 GHVO01050313.1:17-1627(-)
MTGKRTARPETNSAPPLSHAHRWSTQLMIVSLSTDEVWKDALEEASRLYYTERTKSTALYTLLSLYEKEKNKTDPPLGHLNFMQRHGRELNSAARWLRRYRTSNSPSDLDQAWMLYYKVYTKLIARIQTTRVLSLSEISPKLEGLQNLELAVPGKLQTGKDYPTISYFDSSVDVFQTKLRPRKIRIVGSDGVSYKFLLKGKEDMRQGERVIQLFHLINLLLSRDHSRPSGTSHLTCFSITPLPYAVGLIGWVDDCDTLHSLIKSYREERQIDSSIEHRLMTNDCEEYENLPIMKKCSILKRAIDSTAATDFRNQFWLQSYTSEHWLFRRCNYVHSLAAMTMVGYIIGLGDRHPSNIMVNRNTGCTLNIDFGDCFEVTRLRDKHPERVPFRLTRMLCANLEPSGVHGSYRRSCESIITVLRSHRETIYSLIASFVNDPLSTWSCMVKYKDRLRCMVYGHGKFVEGGEGSMIQHDGADKDPFKECGSMVVLRVHRKLSGTEDDVKYPRSVSHQVDRLITNATCIENLSRGFKGWCPYL